MKKELYQQMSHAERAQYHAKKARAFAKVTYILAGLSIFFAVGSVVMKGKTITFADGKICLVEVKN